MTDTLDYGKPRADEDLDALRTILFRSFVAGEAEESVNAWLERGGRPNMRCIRSGDGVVGGLLVIPMAQWFGGRPVSTAGVAGVGVDPSVRGRGIARELMSQALTEFRAEGYPLSTLYASTYGLYRSVGYERAGGHWLASTRLSDLKARDRELEVRPSSADDRGTLEAIQREWARRYSGHLERGSYVWAKIDQPKGVDAHHTWLVVEGETPRGYVRWHQRPSKGTAFYDLAVIDVAALDPRAVRRLLTLFADHSTLGGELTWHSGPNDPLLLALPDRFFRMELADLWMVRILDVQTAFEGRGWPPAVTCELHIGVTDELFPENNGPWVLSVSGGEARVRPGGKGSLRITAGALAQLYTGFLSPADLYQEGALEGTDRDRDLATSLFAGPVPWCPDMF